MRHLRLLLLLTLMLTFHAAQGLGNQNPGDSCLPGLPALGFYFGAACSDSRYGPDMGAYANFGMTDLLGLQFELAYISKGAQLGYVQVAVLARMNQPRSRFRDERNFRPKLLAGFGFATKVSDSRWDHKDNWAFEDTQFSFIFCGGFDHCIWGRRSVTFDFRVDLGMSGIFADWTSTTARFLVGMTL
jgi:hypothetical protein